MTLEPWSVAGAALAMEGVAAVSHRLVMHRKGWGWHRSHHQVRHRALERNDLYPLVFALFTIVVMALASVTQNATVMSIATGVTVYGVAYAFVHDVVIHQRLGVVPGCVARRRYVQWVRESHSIHHLFGKAPYGFLAPLVPRELRTKAQTTERDPLPGRPANERNTVDAFSRVGTTARREKTS